MIDREPEPEEIKMKIYKDPLLQGGEIMGYKGLSFMDKGYIYAPYGMSSANKLIDEAFTKCAADEKPKAYRSITDPWEISRFD